MQFDFEEAWHRAYEVPLELALSEDNASVVPALPAAPPRRSLSKEEAEQYRRDGFLGPWPALDQAALESCRTGIARMEGRHGADEGRLVAGHVLLPWLHDLACHPTVVGAVAAVLDTDTVLLYTSQVRADPGLLSGTIVGNTSDLGEAMPLQQDGRDFSAALAPVEDLVFVRVALTPCDQDGGRLEYMRRLGAGGSNDSFAVDLKPGEMSMHSAKAVYHCGRASVTGGGRASVGLVYASGRVRDRFAEVTAREARDKSMLLCGSGQEVHFSLLPAPTSEWGSLERERWAEVRRLRARRYGKPL